MLNRKDAALSVQAALPNAANTVNGGVIDLEQTTPYPITQQILVRIETTAANGANNKNINIRLQESAESNANFTNIAELANPILRVTDNNGAGYAAGMINIALQPSQKRYLRGVAVGEANGGDSSAGKFTVSILT